MASGVTGAIECRYYGRDFGEMALLRALIAGPPPLNRHMLSRSSAGASAGSSRTAASRTGQGPPSGQQGRPDRPAGAAGTAEPARADRLRAGRPKRRCSRPRRPSTRSVRSTCAPSCAAPGRATLWNEFVARYHYLGYKTLVGAQMHVRRPRPRRLAARHARLLHRRVEARPARQLHRMDTATAREEPSLRGRQPEIPDPDALDQYQPTWVRTSWRSLRRRLPDDWTERYNTTPVLIETFVADPALHRRRLQGLRLDPRRDHPGARALRPGPGSPTSLKRMSGSGPCDGIGNAPSIAKIGRGEWKRPR